MPKGPKTEKNDNSRK